MSRSDNNDSSITSPEISERDFDAESSSFLFEEQPAIEPPGPTPIAAKVSSLKQAALSAVAKRDSLPQTLFWSLIRCEIEVIKKKKREARLMREIF